MKSYRANGAANNGSSDRSKGRRSQRGTATLEMGIVLPLLGGVVMGFIDMGRAYELHTRLTNAAHEGAAFARFSGSGLGGANPSSLGPVLRG